MAKRATPAKSAKRAKAAAKRKPPAAAKRKPPAAAKRKAPAAAKRKAPARAKRKPSRKASRTAKPSSSRKASRTAKPGSSRKASRKAATPPPADPRALTVAQAARLLQVPAETIREHLAAGAPALPGKGDGRLNLIAYAAWLNRRRVAGSGPAEATS